MPFYPRDGFCRGYAQMREEAYRKMYCNNRRSPFAASYDVIKRTAALFTADYTVAESADRCLVEKRARSISEKLKPKSGKTLS